MVLAQLAHVALGGHAHGVERLAGQDGAGGVGHAVDDGDVPLVGAARRLGVGIGLLLGAVGLDLHVQMVGLVLVVHARGERGAERAHQAGDVRAGHLALGEQFERAQHGVIEEGAALHDDRIAELAGIAQLDDLVQRVPDHGVAQTGGDVLDGRALLLRLLDRGVHEHGAA